MASDANQSAESAGRRSAVLALAAAAAVLATRLLAAPRYFENWDVFEFAHALRHFDPSWSQPHVPGFPLFVLAGKLAHLLVRDEIAALRWVSALASALSLPLLYRLGRRAGDRERAALWLAWWCTGPLFWRFGVLPLSYTLEALVAVGL
ncbi:MAG: DUF2723 domain-containing protein, partial [Armatimonadetes bacterium]|nr:DUF2723 domain-containing protein [Armatimonadota bacterium]